MKQLADFLQECLPVIEQELQTLTSYREGCPDRLLAAIRYSLLAGGKRMRPVLALLACEACRGTRSVALPAAIAVEMIHTYSLIHDDLPAMDDDDWRRGQLSNHRRFDEATAILAGDGLLTWAFEVLSTQISDAGKAIRCLQELSVAAGVSGMVGGQQADIEAENRFQNSDSPATGLSKTGTPTFSETNTTSLQLEQLVSIHRRKTGKLITAAVKMGGILGDATESMLASLEQYGDAIGIAFQIQDDILDCTSSQEQMGKRVGKDANRDKLTYPGLLGLKVSQTQASVYYQKAIEALNIFGDQAEGLRAVANYIISRRQ